MATEDILMEAVKAGGDRQELHERIRIHSMEASKGVKEYGLPNDLIERICADTAFKLNKEELLKVLKPENYTGRSGKQVEEFINTCINPILEANLSENVNVEINV
jgi:adenylosuccinate lyase